jgi:hypothetical protein
MFAAVSTPPSVLALRAASTNRCCSLDPIYQLPFAVNNLPRSRDDHHGHRVGLGRGACGSCTRIDQRLVAIPEPETVSNVQAQAKMELSELVLPKRTKPLHAVGTHLLDGARGGLIASDWPRCLCCRFRRCAHSGPRLAHGPRAGLRRDIIRRWPRLPASERESQGDQNEALEKCLHCLTAASAPVVGNAMHISIGQRLAGSR